MAEVLTDEWFKVGDIRSMCSCYETLDADDVDAAFGSGEGVTYT